MSRKSLKMLKSDKSQWRKIGTRSFAIEEVLNQIKYDVVGGETSARVPLSGAENLP